MQNLGSFTDRWSLISLHGWGRKNLKYFLLYWKKYWQEKMEWSWVVGCPCTGDIHFMYFSFCNKLNRLNVLRPKRNMLHYYMHWFYLIILWLTNYKISTFKCCLLIYCRRFVSINLDKITPSQHGFGLFMSQFHAVNHVGGRWIKIGWSKFLCWFCLF